MIEIKGNRETISEDDFFKIVKLAERLKKKGYKVEIKDFIIDFD